MLLAAAVEAFKRPLKKFVTPVLWKDAVFCLINWSRKTSKMPAVKLKHGGAEFDYSVGKVNTSENWATSPFKETVIQTNSCKSECIVGCFY